MEGIEFDSFEPSHDVMTYANAMIRQIRDSLDHGSPIRFKMEQRDGQYLCSCEINTRGKKVSVTALAADPRAVIDQIDMGLRKEMAADYFSAEGRFLDRWSL